MAQSDREKRVVELSRPQFRATAAEQAATATTNLLATAIQTLSNVIARLRDMGESQIGVTQVVGKINGDQARLRVDIAALQIDATSIKGNLAAVDLKIDTVISNQAAILAEIATTHPTP